MTNDNPPDSPPQLERGLGLVQATALNIANMVGVGPFITIPLFLSAMQGPQALVAWIIAALVVLCDGLVWSELGAAIPGSGGSYHFLSVIYGRYSWGRMIPFLFIWQFLISGTLELASGYIGAVDYLKYAMPRLEETLAAWRIPGGTGTVAAVAALTVTASLCRTIRSLGWLSVALCAGTLITVLTVIVAGMTHFDGTLLTFPENSFSLTPKFFHGLGGAMLIAIYDYLGYYNICHLGDEVINPGRTIPRAVMISVIVVAILYLTMNIAIIGVIPWQEAMKSENIAAQFMERLYGRPTAVAFTCLILWTVVACTFAMTLGYSRIPFAAARQGNFFRVFGTVHAGGNYPLVSLWMIGGLTAFFCYFKLDVVINAAVTVRIAIQFIGQIVGLHLLRTTRTDVRFPFRMWLYPLPSAIALSGWAFVLSMSDRVALYGAVGVLGLGAIVWGLRSFWNDSVLLSNPESFRRLISGESRGAIPAAQRAVLRIAAWGYRLAVAIRNAAYQNGWKTVHRAPLPVISIGNLTAGGTGKTPLAAYVARWFRERDVRVCFLSRGYGAAEGGLNDEALVLEQLCPDVPHLQHPDRAASARIADEELESQLLILDDGFQHRRLGRDLEIVLIDASNPWGYDFLLPRGLLREPVSGLARAAVAIITRVEQVPPTQVSSIRRRISEVAPHCDVVEAAFPFTQFVNSDGDDLPLDELRGKSIAAFCGIGNPEAFRRSLEQAGFAIAGYQTFPDHHKYSRADVEQLETWAASLGVAAVVVTQKDLVKIGLTCLGGRPLWALQIGTEIRRGEAEFNRHLEQILATIASRPA